MPIKQDNRTKVKICGLTTLEDARFAAGALADYLGFVFYEQSPRYVEPAKAGAICNWVEGPEKVGVFVNQPLDDVNDIAMQAGIDLVQLHGDESPGYCDMMDVPVIKTFHVSGNTNVSSLKDEMDAYKNSADYFLFDTEVDGLWGGTGKAFDWSLLQKISMDKPFFLSGGLNAENIRKAVQKVKPNVVDLSSGLEEAPGLKDFDKIEEFFDVMRDIWNGENLQASEG